MLEKAQVEAQRAEEALDIPECDEILAKAGCV
jgi:hypothetical protein